MPLAQRPARRAGFTLIELLVVIAIIAVLAGLTLSVVGAVREAATRTTLRNDITQLGAAIEAFKGKFGAYPPSKVELKRSYVATDTSYILLKAYWPRMALTGHFLPAASETIQGDQCLVWFLNGPTQLGFFNDSQYPFGRDIDADNTIDSEDTTLPTGVSAWKAGRAAPFMDFPKDRLHVVRHLDYPTNATLSAYSSFVDVYSDPNATPKKLTPYLYFTTVVGNDYNTLGGSSNEFPCDPLLVNLSPRKFANAYTFQLIAAGKDGKFGRGSSNYTLQLVPGQGDYADKQPGFDDLSNFAPGPMGV